MCDHHPYKACHVCWQTNFYHQYMQQHAAVTQWIQQLHCNIHAEMHCHCSKGNVKYQQPKCCHESYNFSASQTPCKRAVSSRISHSQTDEKDFEDEEDDEEYEDEDCEDEEMSEDTENSDDDDGSESEECEYEFNVDAILAMRAAKEELKEAESKKSREGSGSEESFDFIQNEYEFVELGSLQTLESKRTHGPDGRNVKDEFETEKHLREVYYGNRSAATIAGCETAMKYNFEYQCDDHQPPLWPVLPVRL